jgi:PIN domain nuclease of toxin-antitoxin system
MLDSHVLHWLAHEPERLTARAVNAIEKADDLAVAGPTWYELAWLHAHGRIQTRVPARAWLDQLARDVRTLPVTPAIAVRATGFPKTFPRDPSDRVIFATAVENGLHLVTRDARMRAHDKAGSVVIW